MQLHFFGIKLDFEILKILIPTNNAVFMIPHSTFRSFLQAVASGHH